LHGNTECALDMVDKWVSEYTGRIGSIGDARLLLYLLYTYPTGGGFEARESGCALDVIQATSFSK
jgi:hypothetical protein